MAAATIRRDGFASLESTGAGQAPSFVSTVPLAFSALQTHLFVNVKMSAGGFLQVGIAQEALSSTGDAVFLPGFEPENSSVGDVGVDSCTEVAFDSTRAEVTWGKPENGNGNGNGKRHASAIEHRGGGGGYRFAGGGKGPVRIVFYMGGASLYSFWFAQSSCGESNGYLGASKGSGRDLHGNC